jgi:hypothetical protein
VIGSSEIMILQSVAIVVLSLVIAFKDHNTLRLMREHQMEKKDLLNRIMAKDLNEYKNVNNTSLPKGKSPLRKQEEDFEGLYE